MSLAKEFRTFIQRGNGNFLQVTFDFIVIAFAVFLIVKTVNAMKKKEEAEPAEPAAPAPEVVLLGEIRDLLKGK